MSARTDRRRTGPARERLIVLLLLALAVIVAVTAVRLHFSGSLTLDALLVELGLKPPTVAVEDVSYSTYTARSKTIVNSVMASGYVTSKSEFEAAFPESGGMLKKIYVTAGQFVEEGELLAELDTGELPYLYEQQQLIVQKAALFAGNSEADRLQYEMEQNTLAEYERRLQNSRLYAGMSGQVCFTENLKPGMAVTAYRTIVKVVDPANLFVKYTSNNLRTFSLNSDVVITVNGEEYGGYVSKTPTESVDGLYEEYPHLAADTTSIYCEFNGDIPDFISIGTLADITAIIEVHDNAVVISKNLVKTDGDRKYVTILDENENKKEVDVVVGIENATEAEILSGLSAGDKVVVR